MKRLYLLVFLLFPLVGANAATDGRISKSQITAFITNYSHCEGVEVVRLGRFATSIVKGVVRIAGHSDPDAREALKLMKGVKSLYVLNYEECVPALRDKINRRLTQLFRDTELLMEAGDGGKDKVQIYGLYDEVTDTIRDFVLYTPSECALICIFGSISMDTISQLMAHA